MERQSRVKKTRGAARVRHTPVRTCIACRESSVKRELIRIVRTPEGRVEIDPTGKRSGRGAYLCHNRHCWELALNKSILNQALKTTISAEDLEALKKFASGLPTSAGDES